MYRKSHISIYVMAPKNLQGAIRKFPYLFAREVSYIKNNTKKNILKTGNEKTYRSSNVFSSFVDIYYWFQKES